MIRPGELELVTPQRLKSSARTFTAMSESPNLQRYSPQSESSGIRPIIESMVQKLKTMKTIVLPEEMRIRMNRWRYKLKWAKLLETRPKAHT